MLVTGAGGLLGGQVAWTFAQHGVDVYAFNHKQMDITNADQVREYVGNARPEVVVHCAAMTNVDDCELEPDRASAVNAEGAANVAFAPDEAGAIVVAVSTDYVFDGGRGPYTEDDETKPIQVYGTSKLEGERRVRDAALRHFIVRSAWIYGPGGKNFLSRLPELAAGTNPITAVVDQFGSPTYAPDLAEAIYTLADTDAYGTYHVANEGWCSFAEVFEAGVDFVGSDTVVEHVSVDNLGRPAPRPRDTRLVTDKWRAAGFEPLRPWREAVRAFLAEGLS